jgi:hypothetical protein
MPQAEKNLTDLIVERFGSIDDAGPIQFLVQAGYGLRGDFLWEPKPGVTSNEDMTPEEWDCLLFLIHEWDYGGLAQAEDFTSPVIRSRAATATDLPADWRSTDALNAARKTDPDGS